MKNIPPHWKKVKFKELAKEKSVRVDNPGESGYDIYVGLEHLDSGELVVKRHGSTSDVTSAMKLFSKNDILFARRNTYLRRVSVAPFDGVCSGDIIVLEPILEHIVEDFLPIFMQFEDFENRIIALSAGAFSKRIKWKQLAEEEVIIPSIEVQNKIVNIMWNLQDNIQKAENLITIFEKLNRGILNELITKGFGNTEFKNFDTVEVPIQWEVTELESYLDLITYGFTNPMQDTDEGPWKITAKDIIDGHISYETARHTSQYAFNSDLTEKSKPKINDILLTKDGTIGRVAVVDCEGICINQSVALLRPNEKILPCFLKYLLLAPHYQRIMELDSNGSTIKHIYITRVNKMRVAVPPIEEQKAILDKLDTFAFIRKTTLIHLEKSKNLKIKLTNAFLRGEVRF